MIAICEKKKKYLHNIRITTKSTLSKTNICTRFCCEKVSFTKYNVRFKKKIHVQNMSNYETYFCRFTVITENEKEHHYKEHVAYQLAAIHWCILNFNKMWQFRDGRRTIVKGRFEKGKSNK